MRTFLVMQRVMPTGTSRLAAFFPSKKSAPDRGLDFDAGYIAARDALERGGWIVERHSLMNGKIYERTLLVRRGDGSGDTFIGSDWQEVRP